MTTVLVAWEKTVVDKIDVQVTDEQQPYHLSKTSIIFFSRIVAKAIYDNKLLDCFFTRSFYKHILGKPVHFTDLESFDYSFYQGLQYLLDHDLSDIGMELTFSTEVIGHANLFCCPAAMLFFIGAVWGLSSSFC